MDRTKKAFCDGMWFIRSFSPHFRRHSPLFASLRERPASSMMNAAIALALGASSLAVAVADPRVMIESTYTDTKGLNDLAKTMGSKYMGTVTDVKQLSDKYYSAVLNDTSDFGMITPANMKVRSLLMDEALLLALTQYPARLQWNAIEAKQGVFTFEDADKIVAFATKTGAQVRCPTIVSVSRG